MAIRKILKVTLPRNLWGDRIYGSYLFFKKLGRFPESPPIRFNDHLFLLRTNGAGYDPLVKFVSDKEYAKLYISSVIGSEFVIKTYRILRHKDELNNFTIDRFPCILKPTHSSGQVLVLTDSSTHVDQRKLEKWFNIDFYKNTRQQHYRYLVPKIIVEEFFSEDNQTIPNDYKVFCFNGTPKIIQVDSDRFIGHTRNIYDLTWKRIPVTYVYPNREQDDPEPALLEDMLRLAQKLAEPFAFMRVDFYATDTEIRVGELTLLPEGATGSLNPPEAEFTLGAYFSESTAPKN